MLVFGTKINWERYFISVIIYTNKAYEDNNVNKYCRTTRI